MDYGCFACRRHFEDNMCAIRENPDVIIPSFDVKRGLIDVDEWTVQEPLHQEPLRRCIILGKALEKFEDCPNACVFTKHILHHVDDDTVGETQDQTLINDLCLKGMAEQLTIKLLDCTWIIVGVAFVAIAFFANVLGDRLATTTLSEMEINDGVFHHMFP